MIQLYKELYLLIVRFGKDQLKLIPTGISMHRYFGIVPLIM